MYEAGLPALVTGLTTHFSGAKYSATPPSMAKFHRKSSNYLRSPAPLASQSIYRVSV